MRGLFVLRCFPQHTLFRQLGKVRAIVKKRSGELLWAIHVKILSLEVRGIVHLANQIMPRHPRQAKRPDFEQAVIFVFCSGRAFCPLVTASRFVCVKSLSGPVCQILNDHKRPAYPSPRL